ncbi:MAG: DedA family protein [Bacteroidales bacterium]|jgi:membrane protein DedA with SNARE-associated domain|nr:DedA family protein [Bacteroidales bacterium]MDD2570556.1 DedA family protein [Bacteroidales bacterium]MDD2813083.1 DedA family protein [Bacteroidales bacterium]MDD3385817.1 DedA family protein [Bacteroidales bacterium]MDD3811351.1 DedA family protein [Bacteroidales bacterium]
MELIRELIDWYMQNIGYLTVFLLMMIEGSFIPMPSELVIPPAAFLAAKGELNFVMVVVVGTAGALTGALINYALSYTLGRKVIYMLADTKLAHLILIDREKVIKAEEFFNRNGKSATFIGRLVPAVRQLISIPAGLSKMKLPTFILWTTLGAGIWNIVLALLGYFFYSQKELLEKYFHEITIGVLILGGLFVLWLIIKAVRKRRA